MPSTLKGYTMDIDKILASASKIDNTQRGHTSAVVTDNQLVILSPDIDLTLPKADVVLKAFNSKRTTPKNLVYQVLADKGTIRLVPDGKGNVKPVALNGKPLQIGDEKLYRRVFTLAGKITKAYEIV